MRNVVVTGMGLVTPLEPFRDISDFWRALCEGRPAFRKGPLPLLDLPGEWPVAAVWAMEDRGLVRPEDKLAIMAEEALRTALGDAGLAGDRRLGSAALIVGTVLGNVFLKEKRLMTGPDHAEGPAEGESLHSVSSRLRDECGIRGPARTVSTACASGTDAIGIASRFIESGMTDIAIAGGVDVISDFSIIGFNALGALTDDVVRPFDKNRKGLALGEGAAFVVLESLEGARRRGAQLRGRVEGYASRSDANHLTGPHREGRGLSTAMTAAMNDAGALAADIGYINAHGTGTIYNDLMETKAIKKALGMQAYGVPISSTKSMLGHAFGASGVIEAICCLLAISSGVVPPTANLTERDPDCDLDYVAGQPRPAAFRRALSLSAGFGGQNSVLALGAA